jgi:hypothetical protein
MAVRSGGGELATRAWTIGHRCQLVGQRGAPCLCGACGGGGSEGGRRELSVWRCKRRRKAGGVTLRRRSSTWCLGSQTQHAWGGQRLADEEAASGASGAAQHDGLLAAAPGARRSTTMRGRGGTAMRGQMDFPSCRSHREAKWGTTVW